MGEQLQRILTPEQIHEMMKIKKCICGGTVQIVIDGIYRCQKCKSSYKDDFGKIRIYLDKHQHANAIEISENTGVDRRTVSRFVKYCKLEITESSDVFLKCELCGRDIKSGLICNECNKHIDFMKIMPRKKKEYIQCVGNTPQKVVKREQFDKIMHDRIRHLKIVSNGDYKNPYGSKYTVHSQLVEDLKRKRKNLNQ